MLGIYAQIYEVDIIKYDQTLLMGSEIISNYDYAGTTNQTFNQNRLYRCLSPSWMVINDVEQVVVFVEPTWEYED